LPIWSCRRRPFLDEIAGEGAEDQGAEGKDMRDVGREEGADGNDRPTGAEGRDQEEWEEVHAGRGAEEGCGELGASCSGDDGGSDEQGGEDIDVGGVAGLEGDSR
jgi:hypothetical protein